MFPKRLSLLAAGLLVMPTAHAVVFSIGETLPGGGAVIGDPPSAGLARVLDLSTPANEITDITLTLDIANAPGSTAWNGDFYVQLTSPQGTVAVALNQPGVGSPGDAGYGDMGLNITINDSAGADIHNYQTVAYTLSGAGQLTGAWQSDGRTSPTSPTRGAQLGSLLGQDPNGAWTLLVADESSGNQGRLVGWGVSGVGITAVPEPAAGGSVTALALGALACLLAGRRAGRR